MIHEPCDPVQLLQHTVPSLARQVARARSGSQEAQPPRVRSSVDVDIGLLTALICIARDVDSAVLARGPLRPSRLSPGDWGAGRATSPC